MHSDLVYFKIPESVGTARPEYLVKISEKGSMLGNSNSNSNGNGLENGRLLNSALANWYVP